MLLWNRPFFRTICLFSIGCVLHFGCNVSESHKNNFNPGGNEAEDATLGDSNTAPVAPSIASDSVPVSHTQTTSEIAKEIDLYVDNNYGGSSLALTNLNQQIQFAQQNSQENSDCVLPDREFSYLSLQPIPGTIVEIQEIGAGWQHQVYMMMNQGVPELDQWLASSAMASSGLYGKDPTGDGCANAAIFTIKLAVPITTSTTAPSKVNTSTSSHVSLSISSDSSDTATAPISTSPTSIVTTVTSTLTAVKSTVTTVTSSAKTITISVTTTTSSQTLTTSSHTTTTSNILLPASNFATTTSSTTSVTSVATTASSSVVQVANSIQNPTTLTTANTITNTTLTQTSAVAIAPVKTASAISTQTPAEVEIVNEVENTQENSNEEVATQESSDVQNDNPPSEADSGNVSDQANQSEEVVTLSHVQVVANETTVPIVTQQTSVTSSANQTITQNSQTTSSVTASITQTATAALTSNSQQTTDTTTNITETETAADVAALDSEQLAPLLVFRKPQEVGKKYTFANQYSLDMFCQTVSPDRNWIYSLIEIYPGSVLTFTQEDPNTQEVRNSATTTPLSGTELNINAFLSDPNNVDLATKLGWIGTPNNPNWCNVTENYTVTLQILGAAPVNGSTNQQQINDALLASQANAETALDGLKSQQSQALAQAQTIRSTLPSVAIDSKPSSYVRVNSASFAFSSQQMCSFQVNVDGGGWVDASSPYVLSNLVDGNHSFQVQATNSGKLKNTTATYNWTVDTLNPKTTINSVVFANPSQTLPSNNSTAVSINFSCNKTCTFLYSTDLGNSWHSAVSPLVINNLTNGNHKVFISSTDSYQNTEIMPAEIDWTTDIIAPNITFTQAPSLVTTSSIASFTVATDKPVFFQKSMDNISWTAPTTVLSTSFADSIPNLTGMGVNGNQYTYYILATDSVGNVATAHYSWKVDNTLPHPALTLTTSAYTQSTSQVVTVNVDKSCTIETSHDGITWTTKATSALSFTDTLTALSPGTSQLGRQYAYYGRVTDQLSNTVTASAVWTVDTIPPKANVTNTVSSMASNFALYNTAATTLVIDCGEPCTLKKSTSGFSMWLPLTSSFSQTYTYSLTAKEGLNNLYFMGSDQAGNAQTMMTLYQWTVDTVPPVTSFVSVPTTTGNNTTLVYSANELATFETSRDGSNWTSVTTSLTTAFTDNLTNLVTNVGTSLFTYYVRAKDQAGNLETNPVSATWNIMNVQPNVNIGGHPASVTNTTISPFTVICDRACREEYQLCSGTFCGTGSTWTTATTAYALSQSFTITAPAGKNTIAVRATDQYGNTNITAYSWTIDNTTHALTLTNPTDNVNTTPLVTFLDTPGQEAVFAYDNPNASIDANGNYIQCWQTFYSGSTWAASRLYNYKSLIAAPGTYFTLYRTPVLPADGTNNHSNGVVLTATSISDIGSWINNNIFVSASLYWNNQADCWRNATYKIRLSQTSSSANTLDLTQDASSSIAKEYLFASESIPSTVTSSCNTPDGTNSIYSKLTQYRTLNFSALHATPGTTVQVYKYINPSLAQLTPLPYSSSIQGIPIYQGDISNISNWLADTYSNSDQIAWHYKRYPSCTANYSCDLFNSWCYQPRQTAYYTFQVISPTTVPSAVFTLTKADGSTLNIYDTNYEVDIARRYSSAGNIDWAFQSIATSYSGTFTITFHGSTSSALSTLSVTIPVGSTPQTLQAFSWATQAPFTNAGPWVITIKHN